LGKSIFPSFLNKNLIFRVHKKFSLENRSGITIEFFYFIKIKSCIFFRQDFFKNFDIVVFLLDHYFSDLALDPVYPKFPQNLAKLKAITEYFENQKRLKSLN